MIGQLVKWHCDYFFFVVKMIKNHHQQKRLQIILVVFWIIWRLFFYGVSRFLMYTSSDSRRQSVIGWFIKCHINIFIICVVTEWNLNRDCKNISRHVRLISVLFAKFVNLADSVGHNRISNSFCQMLKFWDLDYIFENIILSNEKYDITIFKKPWTSY